MNSTHEFIRANTYPNQAPLAVDLYDSIQTKLQQCAMPLHFGETSLDVGSRDGRYVSVIRSLGITSIKAIDPSTAELERGGAAGFIAPDEAFYGTLQQYVHAHADKRIDSLFALNM